MRPVTQDCYDWAAGDLGMLVLLRCDGLGITELPLDAEFIGWFEGDANFRLFKPYAWYDKKFSLDEVRRGFDTVLDVSFHRQTLRGFRAEFVGLACSDYLRVLCGLPESAALDELLLA